MTLPSALAPLEAYPRWVAARTRPDPNRPGKTIKEPLDWRTGHLCNPLDPANQTTYANVKASGYLVGFVFTAADRFFLHDIDGAWDGTAWSATAQEICNLFPEAAVEVSQSGTGLHIIGRYTGPAPTHSKKNVALGLELYTDKRFMLLGRPEGARGSAAADCTIALAGLVNRYFTPTPTAAEVQGWTDGPQEGGGLTDDDDELIVIMRGMCSTAAMFGSKASFNDLYTANADALAIAFPDNSSQQRPYDESSADLALANHLAFGTAKDCERIERLMWRSELRRDKWDRPDYLKRTILKACQEVNGVARPFGTGGAEAAAPDDVEPVDLWRRYDPPELPKGLLPLVIERFAFATGHIMGADPAGLAMAALAVCASAISDDIVVRVKRHDTWTEAARLWVGLVGQPSTKKSPIMNAAGGPLRRLDHEKAKLYERLLAEHQAIDAKERKVLPRPKQERFILSDTTVEAAQEVLKDSPNGVLLFHDELSGWFGSMEKYGSGKGAQADRAFWLQAFNGGPYSVNRVGRGAVYIQNLSASLLGAIQPEPIRRIAAEAVDDGLLQRLIPVILTPAHIGSDEASGAERVEYERLVVSLSALRPGPSGIGQKCPAQVQFDDAALVVRERLEREHHELIRALEVISPKLASHFGKYDGIFARLCLLWHCIEHTGHPHLPTEIGVGVAARVAAFMEHFVRASAIAFYSGILGFSDEFETLMGIASLIVADKLSEVDARTVQKSTQSMRSFSADEVRKLLERLESLGWLSSLDTRPRGTAPRWTVNPAVHSLYEERGRLEKARRSAARDAIQLALGSRRR